ncbi:methyl-accepting chemotaxis protein [Paractinoplanes globisporus]|jgi:methyl-accepting chemotaxis protein|uniref:Methyl-accepting chemotaxis protein n=1 Tax=Paractinoplanes globisporus TaxID=113565 RepID=A0ABW6WWL7_9ACTN|nr:methyl-accepting chemotaxis protein [Actinoplanes globisporus]
MMTGRTFGAKLAAGFGLTLVLTLLMTATSVLALRYVMTTKDKVVHTASTSLIEAQTLNALMEQRIGDYRAFLLSGTAEWLNTTNQDRRAFLDQVIRVRETLDDDTADKLLDTVSTAEAAHAAAIDEVVAKRQKIKSLVSTSQLSNDKVKPTRLAVQAAITNLLNRIKKIVNDIRKQSSDRATVAMIFIVGFGGLLVASAAGVAWRLSRDLRREVGAAVGHIQSSSSELEAAAAQQATGGRDQASAMNEITTTISELLITSRQIADSAQRVSKVAEDTAEAARTGDATIDQTRASINAIRAQVDQIVQHMLALGEKSQQIGSVVDLVSELAEQTNILAINATIEASGAGEWGRRFAVVAEEIRKLADRTAGSAKEIRTLIDDVRGAVNTTVMATEIGAKAVDAGSRQFDDATNSFRRIAQLVATTSDATREIELSTKQQTTAVEQVNSAASDTARASRETEASAVQTKQTAAHLSTLSGDLLDLVGTGRH